MAAVASFDGALELQMARGASGYVTFREPFGDNGGANRWRAASGDFYSRCGLFPTLDAGRGRRH
jgi:hypothetical protein